VLPPRPLVLIAFAGLLAVSCNSAVVPVGVVAPGPAVRVAAPAVDGQPAVQSGATADAASPPDAEGSSTGASSPETRAGAESPVASPGTAPIVSPRDPPLAVTPPPPPATKVSLGPLEFISQTVNNCGPASVAEVLKFWGVEKSQEEVQSVLRGDGNPYGMTPVGVPGYMQALGMGVVLGTAGTEDLIKDLLRAGFPVIVNQTVSQADPAFHYRPVEGFDDDKGVFIASDPLQGPSYAISYAEFAQDWKYTGQRFMVIYPTDHQDQLDAALAAGKWDPAFAESGGLAQPWGAPSNGPAPVTSPVIDSGGKPAVDGWYPAKVLVTFKASDPSGFGIAVTTYALDTQPPRLYRGAFAVDGQGKHTLTFSSVNFAGSREKNQAVEIDIGPPPSPTPTPRPSPAIRPAASTPPAPSPTPTPAPPPPAPAGGYKVCPLYDQDQPTKSGAPLALRFQLCDASRQKNLSSGQVTLAAQVMVSFPNDTKFPALAPLRFDAASSDYEIDIAPGLSQGIYVLYFTAAGDTVQHSIQFRIA
jgi:predicted double-glycine peptidase